MKITGTNSYIILDIDGWKIKVEGEMVVGGFFAEKKQCDILNLLMITWF